MENKGNRGGRRPGAGRKSKDIEKYYSFGANKEVADILQSIGGNRTEYINNAISFYFQHHTE